MFCSQCGNDVENASFCNQCGTPTTGSAPPQPEAPQPETPPEQEAQPEAPQPETPPEQEAQPEPPQPEAPPEVEVQPEPPEPVHIEPLPPPPPPMGYTAPPMPPQAPPHHPHHPQPQGYAYHQPAQPGFVGDVYSKAFGFLFKKPILLWGLSVLFSLMTVLAVIFTVFPLLWMPIVLVLQLGMVNIFLSGYRGQTISSTQLFEGFSNKFFRNAGGMGWRSLWLLIWALIPVAGIFISIVKYYSYRFVPYIMLNEPDIHATEALKKSMRQTNGYKGKMFLADLIIYLSVVVASIIFTFILRIPFIGIVLFAIYNILLIALLPLVAGTIEAVYYDKISKENPIE